MGALGARSGGGGVNGDETDPGVIDSIGLAAKIDGGRKRIGYSLANDSRIEGCQAVLGSGADDVVDSVGDCDLASS